MRRALWLAFGLLAAAIALPPLWFRLFPASSPALVAPDELATLPGGLRMHYIERGAGPAVVLVHGLPGQASEWRATTERLAGHGRRVVALDRLGYGHSDARRDEDFTYAGNARNLLDLLAVLELEDATVVGWSYGGGVALAAARADASRIGRLVLVGSVGPSGRGSGPPAIARAIARVFLPWARTVPPVGRRVIQAISERAFSGQAEPDWWLPGVTANLRQPKTLTAYQAEGAGIGAQAAPDSAGLALPILVIHGDDDRLAPVEMGRALARNNPGAELLEVAGGSHMLPVTHAALLADRIAGFSAPRREEPAAPSAPPAVEPASDAPQGWTGPLATR
jgi:pimeloyl-ACP methyl ester carboxylesterase